MKATSRLTVAPRLPSVPITNLQWGMGLFCSAVGALMLVAPHQFAASIFTRLPFLLSLWGVAFLVGGVGLLAVVTFAPQRWFALLAHGLAGGLTLVLAAVCLGAGQSSESSAYLLLGLGTIVAPVLSWRRASRSALGGDALSIVIALGAFAIGLVQLTLPGSFGAARYDPIRPMLPWLGLAFCTSASLVWVSQFRPPRASIGRWLAVPLAILLLVVGVLISVPAHDWTSGIYFGGFGLGLLLFSIQAARRRRLDPRSLRTRLGLTLAAATAVPLIVLVSVVAHNMESQGVFDQLGRQQALAGALAQDISDYVNLHQAAVKVLASRPGLLDLSPAEQHTILQASQSAYPDSVGFGTVAADGEPIARADDRQGPSWIGDPVFEATRRTHQPMLGMRVSPVILRPIFTLSAPVVDTGGNFAGMVTASLESSRLAALLVRTDFGVGARAFLVDRTGHVITHPDPDLVANFTDISAEPAVAAMLADRAVSGSERVEVPGGDVLASYARVPDLGWGVVVEQPTNAALASLYSRLDVLFAGLMFVVAATAGFGVLAATGFTGPLGTLAGAVDRLAAGDSSAPLPGGELTEIVSLAIAFGHLRRQLNARTAERVLAEEALKHRVFHDALTGLPNRSLFTDRLEHAVARVHREANSIAVLFIDLDDFKAVNDTFGHEQGDVLLRVVGDRLRACMRVSDTAARFGGDEFTMLLEDLTGRDAAILVAERIAAELAVPITLDIQDVVMRASIGIAFAAPQSTARELLREADLAMYRAKRNRTGRSYQTFDPSLDVGSTSPTSRRGRELIKTP